MMQFIQAKFKEDSHKPLNNTEIQNSFLPITRLLPLSLHSEPRIHDRSNREPPLSQKKQYIYVSLQDDAEKKDISCALTMRRFRFRCRVKSNLRFTEELFLCCHRRHRESRIVYICKRRGCCESFEEELGKQRVGSSQ